jgi:alkylation response protein AidB-like acyl-CoA dehydrogenase
MNALISDTFVDFLISEVLDVKSMYQWPAFQGHSDETIGPWISANRRVARESLFPFYKAIDEAPPKFVDGHIVMHKKMHAAWNELVSLDVISATRTLPMCVTALSNAYLMAGNLSAFAMLGLTAGAAHLIEAFGNESVKAMFLEAMTSGKWSGTMALTEPHAGSSLGDITTRASPMVGHGFQIRSSKIFISGGDQDITENIVHLVLARIDGAPIGTKGISLFAVPKFRVENGKFIPNDVQVSGVIHKIGWRGLPSLALNFGEESNCTGWLVGTANSGLRHMFQMMNEARLMVGAHAAATASVGFHESLAYAMERRQGRALGSTNVDSPQVPLTQHADVRRMLLRQKAIVEGSLALLAMTAKYADISAHSPVETERARAKLLLDLLTPVAKTFASEKGYESNALALQIHGGYGYSSEYLVESLLRDQKLNSIHEGTSGIQGLDLLSRKVMAGQGAALMALAHEFNRAANGVHGFNVTEFKSGIDMFIDLTSMLGMKGISGDLEGMLGHSSDYMELTSILVVAWVWLTLANAVSARGDNFSKGIKSAAAYWISTEVPRVPALVKLCQENERSYLDVQPEWFSP